MTYRQTKKLTEREREKLYYETSCLHSGIRRLQKVGYPPCVKHDVGKHELPADRRVARSLADT